MQSALLGRATYHPVLAPLRWVSLLAVAFVFAGCSRSTAPTGALSGKNLWLICIDTLRADSVQPYGSKVPTPVMQRLADEGVLFEEATSPVPLTQPAHTSMFTGNYPARHGVRDNSDFILSDGADTLAERFKQAGYQTKAVLAAAVLAKRTGLDQGFDSYDDEFSAQQIAGKVPIVERSGEEVASRARAWIDARDPKRPFFLFTHLYDPHFPYASPGDLGQQFQANPYGGEVAYSDQCIGQIWAHLEAAGELERTAIILVSDHGECLGEHGEATHGLFLYDAAVRVPFLLRYPQGLGPRGLRSKVPVSLVDLAPTAVELFGLKPLTCEGVSLVPLVNGGTIAERELYGETLYPLFYNWSPSFSVRAAGHKFILTPKQEFYDLGADPKEQSNLLASSAERVQSFEKTLLAQLERWQKLTATAEKSHEVASARALAALGYAAGSAASFSPGDQLPDMKDRIGMYDELSLALRSMGEQRWREARKRLEKVLAVDPNNPSALLNMGDVLSRLGEFDKAVQQFELCLKLSPDNRMAKGSLGMLYFSRQRFDQAQRLFEELLAAAPKSAEPMYFLGQIHEMRGETKQALELYERVRELMPNAPGLEQRLAQVKKKLGSS